MPLTSHAHSYDEERQKRPNYVLCVEKKTNYFYFMWTQLSRPQAVGVPLILATEVIFSVNTFVL